MNTQPTNHERLMNHLRRTLAFSAAAMVLALVLYSIELNANIEGVLK